MEILLALFVMGVVGGLIGSGKGLGFLGFFVGMLLGPIGWVIVAVSKGTPDAEARRSVEVQQQVEQMTGVAAPSRVTELERLDALRLSGALTDEEFAAEKRRLLGP